MKRLRGTEARAYRFVKRGRLGVAVGMPTIGVLRHDEVNRQANLPASQGPSHLELTSNPAGSASMEYRDIKYNVVQNIERGIWKWTASVSGLVVMGQASN
jgi:hypothetical protein